VLRAVAKWLLVALLAIYGAYTSWLTISMNAWFLIWALPCFGAAIGLALSKPWGRYLVYAVAACTAIGWALYVGFIAIRGWPYHDVERSIISLVPGLLLVLVCVLAIVFVRDLYKHGKTT
jgi:hypothetical protein